jgi:hypothetical protein
VFSDPLSLPPENQFHDGIDFHKESILWYFVESMPLNIWPLHTVPYKLSATILTTKADSYRVGPEQHLAQLRWRRGAGVYDFYVTEGNIMYLTDGC